MEGFDLFFLGRVNVAILLNLAVYAKQTYANWDFSAAIYLVQNDYLTLHRHARETEVFKCLPNSVSQKRNDE